MHTVHVTISTNYGILSYRTESHEDSRDALTEAAVWVAGESMQGGTRVMSAVLSEYVHPFLRVSDDVTEAVDDAAAAIALEYETWTGGAL